VVATAQRRCRGLSKERAGKGGIPSGLRVINWVLRVNLLILSGLVGWLRSCGFHRHPGLQKLDQFFMAIHSGTHEWGRPSPPRRLGLTPSRPSNGSTTASYPLLAAHPSGV